MDRVNGKRLIAYTACVFLGMWLMASIHAAMGGLQTSMIDAYSLSDSGKGVPSGTLTLFSVIAYFAVLLLIGRVHKAVMLLAGAVIAAIGLLPIHFDLPYSLFLAVLAAVGAGVGITDALASSSVNDLYTGPAGARVMCALHATYGLAGFVMPFLVRAMTGAGVSWRSVFMTLGLRRAVRLGGHSRCDAGTRAGAGRKRGGSAGIGFGREALFRQPQAGRLLGRDVHGRAVSERRARLDAALYGAWA